MVVYIHGVDAAPVQFRVVRQRKNTRMLIVCFIFTPFLKDGEFLNQSFYLARFFFKLELKFCIIK